MVNEHPDGRLPVRFGQPRPGEAALIEGVGAAPVGRAVAHFRLSPARRGHVPGCACCVPRDPAAEALARLFIARARSEVAWFDAIAVVATPAGIAAVRAALQQDQVCASRFRLDEG